MINNQSINHQSRPGYILFYYDITFDQSFHSVIITTPENYGWIVVISTLELTLTYGTIMMGQWDMGHGTIRTTPSMDKTNLKTCLSNFTSFWKKL